VSAAETDRAAQLYAQYYEPLHRYLARYTGDADAAADIAQEAFVRLLEHTPDEAIARPWLFRVATNLARDAARTATRRRVLVMSGRAQLTHADPPPAPDHAIDRSTARDIVGRVLQELQPKERMALLMREEGFAHREIAEALGTTTGSVGTLLARTLRKAAARIRQEQEES
jgi:RNA polymerase sigma-70 factor, ECF subfamily